LTRKSRLSGWCNRQHIKMKSVALLFVCFTFILSVYSQGVVNQEKQPDTLFYEAPEDVSVYAIFPHSPHNTLYVGQKAEIVLGFANHGDQSYTVSFIAASIRHPLDFRYSIQNFTREEYFITIAPSEQQSLAYTFVPSELLEPRDFGLTVGVAFFDAEGRNYTTSFFNQTIDFIEPESGVDAKTFFTYIFALAIGGLAVFGFFKFSASIAEKKGRKNKVEIGTGKQSNLGDEWLEGANFAKGKGPKPQKGQKSRK